MKKNNKNFPLFLPAASTPSFSSIHSVSPSRPTNTHPFFFDRQPQPLHPLCIYRLPLLLPSVVPSPSQLAVIRSLHLTDDSSHHHRHHLDTGILHLSTSPSQPNLPVTSLTTPPSTTATTTKSYRRSLTTIFEPHEIPPRPLHRS